MSNWTGSAWTRVLHEKFLHDGWNLLGAFNGTNAAIIRSFLWGLDLSGAQAGPANMQGAGGVGGLLFFTHHSTPQPSTHCAAYDWNGNVMALVDGKTGSTSARYEYDPFGQTIRASGTMATVNPVRFSSKVVDDETDYAYYGYRYLNPNAGRWLNRDPIQEKGDLNIYAGNRNSHPNVTDAFGLEVTVTGQGGGRSATPVGSRIYRGEKQLGLIVGTFQYPRRGMCGCWERNVYADFTPKYTQPIYHVSSWTSYKDDYSLDADIFDTISQITGYFPTSGTVGGQFGPSAFAGLGAAITANLQRRIDTVEFTVHTEYNETDLFRFENVSWEMSATYYKNGQSKKIADSDCKPKLTMLDAEGVRALTGGLVPSFRGAGMSFGVVGGVSSWVTYDD